MVITPSMRVHMSDKSCKLKIQTYIQKNGPKPKGLWYAIGSEWLDWVRSEMPHWEGKYLYDIDLGDSNILKLNSTLDLYDFTREYRVEDSDDNKWYFKGYYINWDEVRKKYDGIEIQPYIYEARHNIDTFWYYGWDVAGGCIWNLSNIKIKRIKMKKLKKYSFEIHLKILDGNNISTVDAFNKKDAIKKIMDSIIDEPILLKEVSLDEIKNVKLVKGIL